MEGERLMPKFVSPAEAVSCIKDNCSLGISAFGGWLGTDELYAALRERFLSEAHPRGLHIYGGILPGGLDTRDVGMNILALDGLVSVVTAAHVGMAPLFADRIAKNETAGFALPLGVFSKLLRCCAANEPGLISSVGLGSFCDPEIGGCRLNSAAEKYGSPVEKLSLGGKEYLFYPSFALDACFIKASCADEDGNLSVEDEPLSGDQFSMAAAVHNCGGVVIAQVSRIVPSGSISPRSVLLHSGLVDYIVEASPSHNAPGYDCPRFRPELVSRASCEAAEPESIVLDQRSLCARRAALELSRDSIINLGIGIPDGIARVAAQERISQLITLSLESGPIGGIPVMGVGFGAAQSPTALYPLEDNFDFYDGGGLDIAFLGAAEIDAEGNVNVSAFSGKVTGPGGFINIAQNTATVCFMCTFTAGGLKVTAADGKLAIISEGRSHKFKKQVQQVTFSAKTAVERGQRVLYITERAVFSLTKSGLLLTELAPGADLTRDVLDRIDFVPQLSPQLKVMDPAVFTASIMGLREKLES